MMEKSQSGNKYSSIEEFLAKIERIMFKNYQSLLNEKGFNIFFSIPISNLSSDLQIFFQSYSGKNLYLIGSGGKALWDKIPDKNVPDFIDQYSIETMKWFGKTFLDDESIDILFPHDEMVVPLQQLGRFFNFGSPGPIGIDISAQFGLWFAYRGVFLSDKKLEANALLSVVSPCEACLNKPCLTPSSHNEKRLACPIKTEHQYSKEQQSYHLSVVTKLIS